VTGPEAARRLLASSTLRRLGETCGGEVVFLTGGSLRDRLLGRRALDLDLAVTGDAAGLADRIAADAAGRVFPLGRDALVTWRVVAGNRHVDVWGIRSGIESDIRRRDFTINALFWRVPRGPLIDLVGGLDDLGAGRIRVVHPDNLAADPLRILRGLRLIATHPTLRMTAESERLLAAAARGLRRVAPERTVEELRLLLAGRAAERAVAAAARLGVLAVLGPQWEGYAAAPLVSRLAGELARLQRGRHGALSHGAADAARALVAAPAAGFPDAWHSVAAVEALLAVGWPISAAERAARAASFGERLYDALGNRPRAARELAIETDGGLAAALAWAAARAAAAGSDIGPAARRLLGWWRGFAARSPLLDGDEIARQLALPPGPARAHAVSALRRARARGEVRTRGQALQFLRAPTSR
jgi:hypothetical protein